MKLTADMFDFEKYEYRWGYYKNAGDEALFGEGSQWTIPLGNSTPALMRTPKPPPRYILLNEGEKLQKGDEFFAYDGIHPRMWHEMPGRTNDVQKREVWRRKVQE
jgi:hypothetical protein